MSDRLAEIERRWSRANSTWLTECERCAAPGDMLYLVSRVRALEAQAAADRAVAVAVERWVGALGFVANTGQSDWGPLADAFKDVCEAVNKRRAALAAREDGEG